MALSSDRAGAPRLLWLDGARGIAAIAVMCYHYNDLLRLTPLLSCAYLAVDLFFMMSGFVLSHSYESALRSGRLTPGSYLLRRLIRLYPTYLVAIGVGLAYYLSKIVLRTADAPDPFDLLYILGNNVVFVPVMTMKLVPQGMFPLAPSSWSLATEVIASVLYGLVLARASTKVLMVMIGVLGGAFFGCVAAYHAFDLGWGIANFAPGIVRTLFEFTIGMALFRCSNYATRKQMLNPAILLAAVTATLVFVTGSSTLFLTLCILLLFPAFILSAEGRPVHGWCHDLFHQLGRLSYPVYLLHTPVFLWICGLSKMLTKHDPLAAHNRGLGWAMVAITLASSYVVARWIDEPVRAWLNARMRRRAVPKPVMAEDLRS